MHNGLCARAHTHSHAKSQESNLARDKIFYPTPQEEKTRSHKNWKSFNRIHYFHYKHVQERLFPIFNDRNKDALKIALYGVELLGRNWIGVQSELSWRSSQYNKTDEKWEMWQVCGKRRPEAWGHSDAFLLIHSPKNSMRSRKGMDGMGKS